VHDPFEVLFDGVFTQVEPVRDFFVGEPEHEVDDDHLFALGQMVTLLDVAVGAFKFLIEFF